MILSIIIPYYNAQKYTDELLNVLDKQISADVEVILIDDGSKIPYKNKYAWLHVIRQENGGASAARNTGLDAATGDYIAFIDADDMVSPNYVRTILKKIKDEAFDYCYLSWKTLPGGWQCDVKLKSIKDKFPSFNLCVWNRIYKKSMIGAVRFNTKKLIAEDAEFIRLVNEEGKKKAFIPSHMYFYRSTTPDSLTKKFGRGELDTKRIVYHIPHVTKDQVHLIDEFKAADQEGEVILLTDRCEIKELEKYAMIMPANTKIRGTELRGQSTPNFSKIELSNIKKDKNTNKLVKKDKNTNNLLEKPSSFSNNGKEAGYQVIIWTRKTFEIGGIETWIFNFARSLYEKYDILVLYQDMHISQINRLAKFVRVEKINSLKNYKCDTLIINRITDSTPINIAFKKKVQMCHTCRMGQNWIIPKDNDVVVFPSDAAKKSFKHKTGRVIKNLLPEEETKAALTLITASRLNTFEKGKSRLLKLAELLKSEGIPFVWLVFTKTDLGKNIPKGMILMDPELDIKPYIKSADYLVQLSDQESFCYSIVEALTLGTKVITTPIDVLPEIGFKDKEHGYIIPFDIKGADIKEIYENRKREISYHYDNTAVIDDWIDLLGKTVPKHTYNPLALVNTKVTRDYKDIELGEKLYKGTVIKMTRERAEAVRRAGFIEILE